MSEAPRSTAVSILTSAIRLAITLLRGVASGLELALNQVETSGLHSGGGNSSEPAHSEWDVVSENNEATSATPVAGLAPASRKEGYSQIANTLTAAPISCIELCSRLGTRAEAEARAQRAWEAGLWARAAFDKRVPTPRPTPKLNLRPSVYIILAAPGLQSPVRVKTAAEYYKILPRFTPDSLSHSFPSLAEARVYCSAFGIDLPPEAQ